MMYANSVSFLNKGRRQQLLKEISMVDFAIMELTEYLDTHPDDEDAVSYVKQYIAILRKLKEEYASLYGPLTLYDSTYSKNTDWIWAKMPLPWEGGAN